MRRLEVFNNNCRAAGFKELDLDLGAFEGKIFSFLHPFRLMSSA